MKNTIELIKERLKPEDETQLAIYLLEWMLLSDEEKQIFN